MRVLLLMLVLAIPSTFACTMDGQEGFMPENDMSIPVGSKSANSMTEERFNEIIDKVEAVYAPIIKKERRARLKVNRKWTDDTVNASAQQFWKLWIVNMYGGLARHPAVTDDGFALVVCHELGHHLGGAPKNGLPMGWASNEGQSDYFASLKCFRKVFEGDDNIQIIKNMTIDAHAALHCSLQWSNAEDQALCVRSAMAGKALATLLAGGTRSVNFKTPDTSVVDRTNDRHPQGQCRLDTYFQGALCTVPHTTDVSKSDATVGTCNRSGNDQVGIRPLCWYKP
ncbi:MAG: hypothetical protein K9K67_09245 [Bacteriovoracaceae bacterium]|nr:hypothetical protein [Bacteriovoracaceae bacterium]